MDNKAVKISETKNIVCPYCHGNFIVSVQCLSISCRHCNKHINISKNLTLGEKKKKTEIEKRKLICGKCNKEILADKNAQAIICKYCYHRNDLSDHKVKTIIGTIFQTHGQLYLLRKGIIEFSTIQVGSAIIKGKVLGDITAFGTVEILKKGEVRGNITCRSFIVNKGGYFEGHVQILPPDNSQVLSKLGYRIPEQFNFY